MTAIPSVDALISGALAPRERAGPIIRFADWIFPASDKRYENLALPPAVRERAIAQLKADDVKGHARHERNRIKAASLLLAAVVVSGVSAPVAFWLGASWISWAAWVPPLALFGWAYLTIRNCLVCSAETDVIRRCVKALVDISSLRLEPDPDVRTQLLERLSALEFGISQFLPAAITRGSACKETEVFAHCRRASLHVKTLSPRVAMPHRGDLDLVYNEILHLSLIALDRRWGDMKVVEEIPAPTRQERIKGIVKNVATGATPLILFGLLKLLGLNVFAIPGVEVLSCLFLLYYTLKSIDPEFKSTLGELKELHGVLSAVAGKRG